MAKLGRPPVPGRREETKLTTEDKTLIMAAAPHVGAKSLSAAIAILAIERAHQIIQHEAGSEPPS